VAINQYLTLGALSLSRSLSVVQVDPAKDDEILGIIRSCIGTKFISRWAEPMCKMALEAVRIVTRDLNAQKEVDIKRYVRIERVRACLLGCLLALTVMYSPPGTHRFREATWRIPRWCAVAS